MGKKALTNKKIETLVGKIIRTYEGDIGINFIDVSNLPVREKIIEILHLLMEVLFPGYTGKRSITKSNVKYIVVDILYHLYTELCEQIERAYRYGCRMAECDKGDCRKMAQDAAQNLLNQMPKIRQLLKGDVAAAFDGDPAAKSYEEVVLSYPCIIAIAA